MTIKVFILVRPRLFPTNIWIRNKTKYLDVLQNSNISSRNEVPKWYDWVS